MPPDLQEAFRAMIEAGVFAGENPIENQTHDELVAIQRWGVAVVTSGSLPVFQRVAVAATSAAELVRSKGKELKQLGRTRSTLIAELRVIAEYDEATEPGTFYSRV
jgi:hypothetical protein